MDSLKQSFSAMSEMFHTRMNEFQHELQKNSSSKIAATTSSIAADFEAFKIFIIATLNTLQHQVEFLRTELDRQEMRRRRKMLLLHGIPERKTENLNSRVVSVFAEHLDLPNFSSSSIKTTYRLGRSPTKKPRPVVVKFTDVMVRKQVWYAKTKFKGTGITQSEYLTKPRHDLFLEARKRFGVTNCWTRDGYVYIISPDGVRHQVECRGDLELIPVASRSAVEDGSPALSPGTVVKSPETRLPISRTRRAVKK
ncbi:uncharacterized protein LOC125075693 [Vanessa atalanta]|uniref:uncharacterized protein LOC125075693 n=1 Tax=Vanessa atalanta TaxID=42275 RepID=UPI001FCD2671|nr:uncharacterized protein LOC125075693 [Vanessa atalanta]